MNVKISKPINIRKGPGTSFDIIGVANPNGETIAMDGIVPGETLNGRGNWYFKINDNNETQYYWEGGIAPGIQATVNVQQYLDNRFVGQNLISPIDYNFLLNVDSSLKQNMGEGTSIGVIDSPINTALQTKKPIKRPIPSVTPASFHGTFIANIIGGNGNIQGAAPNATIIDLPSFDADGNIQSVNNLTTMFAAVSAMQGVVILNVSQGLRNYQFDLSTLKNVIIVASAGLDEQLQNPITLNPARMPDCIAVGGVTKDFYLRNPSIQFDSKVDFILPAFKYISYDIDGKTIIRDDDNSSCATAIVTCLVSLICSSGITDLSLKNIKAQLAKISKPYNDKNNIDLLNPLIPPK